MNHFSYHWNIWILLWNSLASVGIQRFILQNDVFFLFSESYFVSVIRVRVRGRVKMLGMCAH